MMVDLDDPLQPEDYDIVEHLIRDQRITWGRLQMLFDANPDFCNWYNQRALERNFADVE